MKEITFKKAKQNFFYAKKESDGTLLEVKDPVIGEKYLEIPVVSGG